jgi:energy-coupling factor transport system ATP-binding protein
VSEPAGSRSGGADVSVKGLTWRPARRRAPVLRDLDLHIPAGQRVLVAGPSGAGKSTLLRALAGQLLTATEGDLAGEVLVDGRPVARARRRPGLLFQDPRTGIVADTVGRDVAFGLENLAVPPAGIWGRVAAALDAAGFPYPPEHPTSALSGGESQRLALAGSLALGGGVLLLDEPVSMLDPAASQWVVDAVRHHAASTGSTTVIVDHHLERWMSLVDRLLVLDSDGGVVADGEPGRVLAEQRDALLTEGVWVPDAPLPQPLDVPAELTAPHSPGPADLVEAREVTLKLTNRLTRRREPPTLALSGVDAMLRSGRVLAATGPSGAGKSSLVAVLAGLKRPTSGTVVSAAELATRHGREPFRWRSRDLAARLAWAPQLPEQGMVTSSVLDEVLATPRGCGHDERLARRRAGGLLDLLGLSVLAAASPYHLSGGEQRRLMVAAALAAGPSGLLLDEPTVGQDRSTWAAMVGVLQAARAAGTAVAVATHDTDAVAVLADDELALDHGVVLR